ncbi:hypothetical protein B0H11DRAFT_2201507 [Mycena galericulata]|nr:hypothetical protein B0H11DRAFT_2201507 [Mycena galericulata]
MDSGQARRCAVARARRRHMGVVPQQRSEHVQAKGISVPCRRARVCVYCIGNHDNAVLSGAIGTASALSRVIAHQETIAAPAAFTPAVAQFVHCARRPRARARPGLEDSKWRQSSAARFAHSSPSLGVSNLFLTKVAVFRVVALPMLRTELTPPARQVGGGGGIVFVRIRAQTRCRRLALARACSNSTSSTRKLAGAGQSLQQLGRERTADECVGGRRDRESGGAGGSAGHVGHGYGRAAACPGFGGHHDP